MHIFVYALSGPIFEGDGSSASIPAEDGILTILPGHAPIVVALSKGSLRIRAGEEVSIPISRGFAHVDGNRLLCLVED